MIRYLCFILAAVAVFAAAGCASDRGGSYSSAAPSFNSGSSGGGSCPSCR